MGRKQQVSCYFLISSFLLNFIRLPSLLVFLSLRYSFPLLRLLHRLSFFQENWLSKPLSLILPTGLQSCKQSPCQILAFYLTGNSHNQALSYWVSIFEFFTSKRLKYAQLGPRLVFDDETICTGIREALGSMADVTDKANNNFGEEKV